jgi:hypothetical protein
MVPFNTQQALNDPNATEVRIQVQRHRRTGQQVCPAVAMLIASWYQSPGTEGHRFAQFASTGTLPTGLPADIRRELRDPDADPALWALLDYAQESVIRLLTEDRTPSLAVYRDDDGWDVEVDTDGYGTIRRFGAASDDALEQVMEQGREILLDR